MDSVHRYNKKMESLTSEYNLMLAHTLDSQRVYFERRLHELNQEESAIVELKKQEVAETEERLVELDIRIGQAIE